MTRLVIQEPDGGRQVHLLDGPEYILGRDPTVDISLADRKVSRRHARIFARDNTYWVEDLGSANGVVIEGKPIDAPRELGFGLSVAIGGFRLSLQATTEERATPSFSLLGLSEPLAGQRFVLPAGELPVGRVDDCAILVPDASVSRRQATLTVTTAGVAVEDHGSSNGTWINGGRIESGTLHPGDRVRFGTVELELELAGRSHTSAVPARGWNRFSRANRTIQMAVIIGLLSTLLLLVTIVVALGR
jgi:pSer/pThr/pTyr-binding forkhead associated (FHA) protein